MRVLKKEFDNVKLEFDYLSSTENLIKFQNLYFDDELIRKDIRKIQIIKKNQQTLKIEELRINNE